uniref:Uncharacterized protein n=1 Tax=Pseudictyota dubia TaxID=2749911 RepID=A0A7R9Z5K1_9STRA|mmetsp:Transcript_24503/g.45317  ORF Transcript_24503/g.45317 Transcript_24503/m.45317 type:complete len:240 (+) Transcript_24503:192-911(+)|eukprot:CAMPEP_0197438314 /NCGR_PEP_ID=MMETSP1175-20131217/5349_1 /TAXON_ID=1003142 /ORGANISM="Triceratium dubium, Strain CCMP147" /LENGTH=239 /DNA_ID=CAMNT_0042968019 /DNA_START=184 /DNA_END=903 /DNA_ORIENTATION=+
MASWKYFCFAALWLVHVTARAEEDEFDIMEYLEKDSSARLMKNKEPIVPSSPYHEEDPIVVEHIEGERAAHVVKSKGPVTKKIVANGSHSHFCQDGGEKPGCEAMFSLVMWKFADQDVKGKMENKFRSGKTMKVNVDCLKLGMNAAIVGGVVTEGGEMKDIENKRAYAMVINGDAETGEDQISGLSLSGPIDGSCDDYDFDDFKKDSYFDMSQAYVKLCNRRDGEETWLDCLSSAKKVA